MKVPRNDGVQWPHGASGPLESLISAFAPSCYAPTWIPWVRWVGAACIVFVLVVVLHLATGSQVILPIR